MERRTQLLEWLQEKGVNNFEEVSEIIAEYYKNKEDILKMINAENAEYSLEDVIEAEDKIDLSRPDRLDNAVEEEKKNREELSGKDPVEVKKQIDENPVAELERKLKSEREKVENIRSRTKEQEDEDPFEKSEDVDENPFEA